MYVCSNNYIIVHSEKPYFVIITHLTRLVNVVFLKKRLIGVD